MSHQQGKIIIKAIVVGPWSHNPYLVETNDNDIFTIWHIGNGETSGARSVDN